MLATVASVNSAQRLRNRISETSHIPSRIIQTPALLSKDGCGYSLRFDDKYKSEVKSAASYLRINIRAFYREENTDGNIEYIKE